MRLNLGFILQRMFYIYRRKPKEYSKLFKSRGFTLVLFSQFLFLFIQLNVSRASEFYFTELGQF